MPARCIFCTWSRQKAHQKENCRVKTVLGKPACSLSGLPNPQVMTLADIGPDRKRIVARHQPKSSPLERIAPW
jgi:hypothetical protein